MKLLFKLFISFTLLCQWALFQKSVPVMAEQADQQHPNILFIAIDDLKPLLGCYGNELIKTPNIDRLAERGTLFLNNHCQQAVCAPSRASLMTGRRPDYTKIWDLKTHIRDINPDILTLPQYFRTQGYKTVGIGKLYDPRSVDKSFDKPSWSVPYLQVEKSDYYNGVPPLFGHYQLSETRKQVEKYLAEADEKGIKGRVAYARENVFPSLECADVPDEAYIDGAMTDIAKGVLSELAEEGKPFFFGVGFKKPHLPFVAPKKYWDMYRREDIPLAQFEKHAKNSPDVAYHDSHELKSYTDIPPMCSFTDIGDNRTGLKKEKQKEVVHAYYATVTYVDALIGKLLYALDSLGLADNTIVILWGDHGWHLGDHDLWGKDSNFENSTHAPMIITAPGIAPGKTNSPTEFVDIFPTICELAGIPVPENLDGVSLVTLMKDPQGSVKEYAVSQFPHKGCPTKIGSNQLTGRFLGNDQRSKIGCMGYTIRTKRYRLTYWMEPGFRSDQPFSNDLVVAREFYDYQKDPLETVNLINEKKYAPEVGKLESMIKEFFKDQERNGS